MADLDRNSTKLQDAIVNVVLYVKLQMCYTSIISCMYATFLLLLNQVKRVERQ